MAKLLPFKPELPSRDRQPRLVDLDDDTADDVFSALSSETARNIVSHLYQEPATASDVAESVDTSLQNARYHLDKLQAAGVIDAVDTWYSSRGTEMTVYAPTNEPLVVAAGKEESTGVLREALTRMLSAVAILGLVSVLVDQWARRVLTRAVRRTTVAAGGAAFETENDRSTVEEAAAGDGGGGGGGGDMAAMEATPTSTSTPQLTDAPDTAVRTVVETRQVTATPKPAPSPTPVAETMTPQPTTTPTPLVEQTQSQVMTTTAAPPPIDAGLIGGIPPGALFFAGGLLVVLLIGAWWYTARYRPLYD